MKKGGGKRQPLQGFTNDLNGCLTHTGEFPRKLFKTRHPTVSVALMRGNQVCLVQSSKRSEGDQGPSWILPQVGVEQRETIYTSMIKKMNQGLGLSLTPETLEKLKSESMLRVLGWYENPPRSRGEKPKLIVVVGIQIDNLRLRDFSLSEDHSKVTFVHSGHHLWNVMACTRKHKLLATLYALQEAHVRGLIGWSTESIILDLSQMAEAA